MFCCIIRKSKKPKQPPLPQKSQSTFKTPNFIMEFESEEKEPEQRSVPSSNDHHSSSQNEALASMIEEREESQEMRQIMEEQVHLQRTLIKEIIEKCIQSKMEKISQSSLAGMRKEISETLIDDDSEEAVLQFYSKDINEMFSRCVISHNYSKAKEIFIKMSKSQKNSQDEEGLSPLHLCVLAYVHRKDNIELVKFVLYDDEVDVHRRGRMTNKPIQQAIAYKDIILLTHLVRTSQIKTKITILSQLNHFSSYLSTLPDFSVSVKVKVGSFLPFVEKIAPNDTILIHKKDNKLRIDYTLVGYSYLKCKRRNMSCVIESQGNITNIYAINHEQSTYTNLLQSLTTNEIILIIQDLLTHSNLNQKKLLFDEVNLTRMKDFFQDDIEQQVGQYTALKHRLNLKYSSIKNTSSMKHDLSYLNDWESYEAYIEPRTTKKKEKKEVNLDLWLTPSYQLKTQNFMKIMNTFSIVNDIGQIIHDFLSHEKIQAALALFPIKIQIPINFSLYFDVEFGDVGPCSEAIDLDFKSKYTYRKREEYQKTLERQEKRLLLIKLYI